MTTWSDRLAGFDAHHRLLIAGVAALAVGCGTALFGHISWVLAPLVGWDTFAVVMLALSWMRIILADARTSAAEAKLQDQNRSTIFMIVLVAAAAALVGVGFLLATGKEAGKSVQAAHIIAAGITVVLSWGLIHTLYALHYAHLFYQRPPKKDAEHGGGKGLDFPGDGHPGYMDFAYFSFVVGMTCQVSDVQITARPLRRLVLIHGLLSFAYNTVILALTINLSSSFVSS